MKLQICFVSILLLICLVDFAQAKSEIRFTSINQMGILTGESSTQIQMQTINGIGYKKVAAGIGIGLDDYYERTMPVFFQLRKSFFNKAGAPFLYADAGYSFLVEDSRTEWEMDRRGGAYYAAGIGYELPVNGNVKAVFDIGYSYKHFSKIIDNQPWRSSLHNFDTYYYSLNRISIKGGLRF